MIRSGAQMFLDLCLNILFIHQHCRQNIRLMGLPYELLGIGSVFHFPINTVFLLAEHQPEGYRI